MYFLDIKVVPGCYEVVTFSFFVFRLYILNQNQHLSKNKKALMIFLIKLFLICTYMEYKIESFPTTAHQHTNRGFLLDGLSFITYKNGLK